MGLEKALHIRSILDVSNVRDEKKDYGHYYTTDEYSLYHDA